MAEWRNEVQLGSENLLATSLYQPLDAAHRFFVEPRLVWGRNWEYVFLDGERLARYRLSDVGGSLDTGINLEQLARSCAWGTCTRAATSR